MKLRFWIKTKDSLKRDLSILGELGRVYDLLASSGVITKEVHDDLVKFIAKKQELWLKRMRED